MEWHDRIGRRLRLRDLHTFFAVANRGSMARAAAELSLTQPAVSKAMADMERLLGVKLLDRTPQGVRPTTYGKVLLDRATAIFNDLRRTVTELESLADPTAGELRLGASDPLVGAVLPPLIDRLSQQHPRLAFHVTHGLNEQLLRALRERSLDLVFSRLTQPKADDLELQFLFDDPLVVIAGTQSPWARRRRIALAELVHEPWVLASAAAITPMIQQAFSAAGAGQPRAGVSCNSIQLQEALIATGRFLTMLPASYARFSARRGSMKVLPVKLGVNPPPVGIATLKHRTISPVAKLFVDSLKSMVAKA